VGVEAAGHGLASGAHAASISAGRRGVLHGALMYLLHDDDGQIAPAHSVSAGLDYPGVGPEHAYYADAGIADLRRRRRPPALAAFRRVAELEGIIPALETAHAFAYVMQEAPTMRPTRSSSSTSRAAATRTSPRWPACLPARTGAGALVSAGSRARPRSRRRVSRGRIARAFARADVAGRAAFVAYLTAGYPDAERALAAARVLARHADLLEIGLPFSDPLGDGPTIQRASEVASRPAPPPARRSAMVRACGAESEVALAVMTYYNPVYAYRGPAGSGRGRLRARRARGRGRRPDPARPAAGRGRRR
jgi:hypothetical protein